MRLARKSFLLVISILIISHCAYAKEYDGIWFMGFNLKKPLLQNLLVRQAVSHTIDKEFIATMIMSDESVPASVIPPGMPGYDPSLKPYKYNVKYAKTLMKKARLSPKDKRLKGLTLLHTDGIKTVEIADNIKNSLKDIGVKVNLVEISFKEQEKWANELQSGKYDLFLMGYKAGIEQLFTQEAGAAPADSYSLIYPLFQSKRGANFTGYSNVEVDELLGQVEALNTAMKSERSSRLKEVNKIVYKDLPVVVLFYIEKL